MTKNYAITLSADIFPDSIGKKLYVQIPDSFSFDFGRFALTLHEYTLDPFENLVDHNLCLQLKIFSSLVRDFANDEWKDIGTLNVFQQRKSVFQAKIPHLFMITHNGEDDKIEFKLDFSSNYCGIRTFNPFKMFVMFRVHEIQ